ncbi:MULTISPECIES: PRC-barrel domain-containing protein [unclassified Micromonospora]|uniref:PRC-barrel domain-containing protein n=1 Tax=Micromonospora TaxID=1873 RepID=UPI0022B6A160|nr:MULTISPECIES: PRC-barrel domain-containing protein [unclassified Micromonospora]MCZ7420465.1 PRC-barrel domain-containing protein [Verrucosispora sp. WMMA2121]WBB89042.1 PRC-barrel domain-containing protein [Verrucosispora sp. WMMC514]
MDRLDPNTTHTTPDPELRAVDQSVVAGGPPAGAFDPWSYRDEAGVAGANLVGYKVEASDGSIGKIDSDSTEVNASYLVVDTGPWIFGKKVMLPAGTVNHVDHEEQKVFVDRTKDQIKAAPEYDETATDPAYRDKLGGYYNDTYSAMPPGGPLR